MTDCPPDPPKGPDRCNTTFMENNTAIRDYFTEDEWDLIYNFIGHALDDEEFNPEDVYEVRNKIHQLFNN